MAINNIIQLGREIQAFVKEETTKGTIIYPTASDMIVIAGVPDFNQNPTYTDSTEIRNTRSLLARFRDKFPAGNFSFPMYCRPSGSLGVVPDGAALFKAAMGVETINASTSVVYTLTKNLPSVSIFFAQDDMVFGLVGSTVNELRLSMSNKGALTFNFAGGFMEMKFAGKAEITSHAAGVVTLKATGDWKKYKKDMKVKFYDVDTTTWYDNTGAGYTITNVDSANNQITVDPAISEFTPAADDICMGWLPTGTETGDPIEAALGSVEFDSTAVDVIAAEFTLTNNVKYSEEEITAEDYPKDYVADKRSVALRTSLFLRTEDLKYFRDGQDQVHVDVDLKGGDTEGYKIILNVPEAVGSVPAMGGELERTLDIDWIGLATSTMEDEVSLTFI